MLAKLGEKIGSLFTPEPAEAELAPKSDTELVAERTSRAKVFQRPDGTRYAKIFSSPVHYQDARGAWKEIDNTLVVEGDRRRNKANRFMVSLASRAEAPDLVTVSEGEAKISFGLPGAFGEGRASGNEVSFSGASDGDDLELVAHNLGLKETILLKRPREEILFNLSVQGLRASINQTGDVEFADPSGEVRFIVPHGFMEDSADLGSGEGNISEGVTYEIVGPPDTPTGLRLRLDMVWLLDPQRVWPVKVDPSIAIKQTEPDDTFVQSNISFTRQDSSTELRAGYCGVSTTCGGTFAARSLMRFPLPPGVAGNQITLARLDIYNWHSWSCDPRWVNVREILGGWDGSVTWPNQPPMGGPIASINASKRSGCGPDWLRISGQGLTDVVDAWSRFGRPNDGLGVTGDPENDTYTWKKFWSYQHAQQTGDGGYPTLYIEYNRPPNTPNIVGPAEGQVFKTFSPTLQVSDAGDPDNDSFRDYYFEVWVNNGSQVTYRNWSIDANWTIPTGLLKDGGWYAWRAMAGDGRLTSAWTPWRTFKLDVLRLGSRPYYPTDGHSLGNGTSATVNLASGNLSVEQTDVNLPTSSAPFSFVRTYNSKGAGKGPQVYLEDGNGRPLNATWSGDTDGWNWVTDKVWSGAQSHYASIKPGIHQHFFDGAQEQLFVPPGSTLVTYAWLTGDGTNPLQEVMLQFSALDGAGWDHRAYWGANNIPWGVDGTTSRRSMGALPPTGQWVRLEVPAWAVGLENKVISGVAYTLYGGGAWWDKTMLGGGSLGHGWSFGTELTLDFLNFIKLRDRRSESQVVELTDRSGGAHFYYDVGNGTLINEQGDMATGKVPGWHNGGACADNQWQFTTASKVVYCFNSTGDANDGTVERVIVPQQQSVPGLQYLFVGGKLDAVLDATGTRKIKLVYNSGPSPYQGTKLDALDLYVKDSAGIWPAAANQRVVTYTMSAGTTATDGGLLTSVTDASGHRTGYTYDPPTGDMLTITTPRGTVTTEANDFKTTIDYQAALTGEAWRRVSAVKRNHLEGTWKTYTVGYSYDTTNKQTKVTEPKGVLTTANPNDWVTTHKYDDKDNPVSVIDPAGTTSKFTWFDNYKTGETDRTDRRTGYTFDAEGRPLLTVRPVVDPVTKQSIKPSPGAGETSPQGFKAVYYPNKSLAPHPVVIRNEGSVNFDWGSGSPDPLIPVDFFSARWVGYLNVPQTGSYTFWATGDDGVRLWVAGARLVDYWATQPFTERSGSVTLDAGWHPVVLDYFEQDGGAAVRLEWAGPSLTRQVIPAASVRPAWVVSESQYDGEGNRIRTIDAEFGEATYQYDTPSNHRLNGEIDPAGNRTSYKYYSPSHPVGDPCYTTTSWKDGLLCKKTMPAGGVTTYSYFDGELYTENGNAALLNVRQTGFLKSVTDPGLVTISCHSAAVTACFHYDWRGNRVHERSAKGDSYLAYDADNQLTKSEALGSLNGSEVGSTFTGYPNAIQWVTYTYDADGNRTKITDPVLAGAPYNGDKTASAFDDLNRFLSSTDAWGGQTTYAYNENSFMTSKSSPAGTTTYTPTTDGLDRLASLIDTQGKVFSFSWDAEGRLTRTAYPNTTHVDYGYGGQGELVSQQNARVATHAAGEALISGFAYAYDNTGQKLAEAGPAGRTGYAYDRTGRLEGVTDAAGTSDSYRFDQNSNRNRSVIGATTRLSAPGSWSSIKGTWRIKTGELAQTDTGAGNRLLYSQDFPQDLTVEAKVKFVAAGTAGIVFRQSAQEGATSTNSVRLNDSLDRAEVVVGGTVYYVATTVTTGTYYTLKAVLSGSTLNFYVNGVLKITRTDLPATVSNYVGLENSSSEARFDAFKVWVGSQGTVAASDDFSFRTTNGEWGYQGGAITQFGTAQSEYGVASDPVTDASYTLQVSLKNTYDLEGRKRAGVLVDWTSTTASPWYGYGYRVMHIDGSWVVHKFRSDGTWVEIGAGQSDQGHSPTWGWESVTVNRNRTSGTFELVVDGKVIGNWTDTSSPITTGGAGLYAYQAKVSFKDLRIFTGGTIKTFAYDGALSDRLVSTTAGATTAYCYDPTGSLKSYKTSPDNCSVDGEVGETRLVFDPKDRLTQETKSDGTVVAYVRDGSDRVIRRTQGSTEIRLRYDSGSDAVGFETDAASAINRKLTSGPPGLMVDYKGTTFTPSYAYFNGHGDLVNTASSTGATTATYRNDPFGVQITGPNPDPDTSALKNRYVGRWQRELDATTGLILMGARPYDPVLGRFLARDPIEGGSCNDYDYTCQDPINNYDLDGLCTATTVDAGVCIGVAVGGPPGAVVGAAIGGLILVGGGIYLWAKKNGRDNARGDDLRREGEEILGRAHSPERAKRWRQWYDKLSKRDKELYRKRGGPRPRKRN